jgi:hypothetical protein
VQRRNLEVGIRRDPNHLAALMVFTSRFSDEPEHIVFADAARLCLFAAVGFGTDAEVPLTFGASCYIVIDSHGACPSTAFAASRVSLQAAAGVEAAFPIELPQH